MSIHIKVITSMILLIAAGVAASFGIASFLPTPPGPVIPPDQLIEALTDIAFGDASTFPTKLFTLDEGYSIELVDGWEVVSHTPSRQVDRYRFERTDNRHHIFTVSVYDRKQTPAFADLVAARYGASMLRENTNVTIAGLPAKRVTADFLEMGATADLLVQVSPDHFVSLYGVRDPSVDGDLQVAKQINFMQKSFRLAPVN